MEKPPIKPLLPPKKPPMPDTHPHKMPNHVPCIPCDPKMLYEMYCHMKRCHRHERKMLKWMMEQCQRAMGKHPSRYPYNPYGHHHGCHKPHHHHPHHNPYGEHGMYLESSSSPDYYDSPGSMYYRESPNNDSSSS